MPSMSKQQRRYNLTPSRRKITGIGSEAQRTRRTPITLKHVIAAGGTSVTVQTNEECFLTGYFDKPGWIINDTIVVSSAVQTGSKAFTLTMSGAVVATDVLVVPFEDAMLRNQAGGYVRDLGWVVESGS